MAYTQASFMPNTFVDGSLFTNVDVVIEAARATMFQYPGATTAAAGLLVSCREIATGVLHENQFWSAGAKLIPDSTGRFFIADGNAAIAKGSNLGFFLASLAKVGVPATFLTGDVQLLVGLRLRVERKKSSELAASMGVNRGGDMKDGEVLVATALRGLPGESAGPVMAQQMPPQQMPGQAMPGPATSVAPLPSSSCRTA